MEKLPLTNIDKNEIRSGDALKIYKTYNNFERFLLSSGKLPAKNTGIGFWGVVNLESLFDAFEKINLGKYANFVDLGSGDGRVVLLASLFNVKAVGIEFDSWLHKVACHIKEHISLPHFAMTKFLKKDFMLHNIRGFDVVFIHPDKPFYRGLEEKFLNELGGVLIVQSNEFQPGTLKKVNEFFIKGERYCIYKAGR